MFGRICGCGHAMSEHGEWGCRAVVDEYQNWGLEASDSAGSYRQLCSCDRAAAPEPTRPHHRGSETRRWRPWEPPSPRPPSLPVRLARSYPEDSPTHRLLLTLDQLLERPPAQEALALDSPGLDAWAPLLDRRDRDAALLLQQLRGSRAEKLLPFRSARLTVETRNRHGSEWAARLVPSRPTAAVSLVADWARTQAMLTDPLTHAPIVAPTGKTLRTVPCRWLPAGTRLAAVVQDRIAWLRSTDGTLHPVRQQWSPGLVVLLLHDATADADQRLPEAPQSLVRLLRRLRPQGTLTRTELEAALLNERPPQGG